jgi:hypothetical protein
MFYFIFGCIQMRGVVQNSDRVIAKGSLLSAWRMSFLFSSALFLGTVNLHAQCPDTGQTKVIRPHQGSGYYFLQVYGR